MQIKRTIISGSAEPVTLAEAKAWLKATDYTDDDVMIGMIISGVRDQLERFTGLSLIASTIEYFDDEIASEIVLPYPNHNSISEVKINGEVSTNYVKTGNGQIIITPLSAFTSAITEKGIKITYTTLGECPEGLKLDILKAIDEKYRNRGNTFEGSITDLSENTYSNAAKYCMI